MVKISVLVLINSTFADLFAINGLLNPIKSLILQIAKYTTDFTAILIAAIFSSFIACNQTLAIILTKDFGEVLIDDRDKLALYIENTAAVIPGMVPWSIACAVPLASISAPTISVLLCSYLIILPISSLIKSIYSK